MKFPELMKNVQSEESTTTVRPLKDSASEVEEVEKSSASMSRAANSNRQGIFLVYANPVCSDFWSGAVIVSGVT